MSVDSNVDVIEVDILSDGFYRENVSLVCAYRIGLSGSKGFYVGSTVSLAGRICVHRHHLRFGTHPSKKFQSEFDKHRDFKRMKLWVSPQDSKLSAQILEQKWMDEFKLTEGLLNHSSNARNPGSGHEISDETRAKLSAFRSTCKMSPEQRMRMSEAQKAVARYGAKHVRARAVIVAGVEYGSIGEAARALGLLKDTLRLRVYNPNFPNAYFKHDELDNVTPYK